MLLEHEIMYQGDRTLDLSMFSGVDLEKLKKDKLGPCFTCKKGKSSAEMQ